MEKQTEPTPLSADNIELKQLITEQLGAIKAMQRDLKKADALPLGNKQREAALAACVERVLATAGLVGAGLERAAGLVGAGGLLVDK